MLADRCAMYARLSAVHVLRKELHLVIAAAAFGWGLHPAEGLFTRSVATLPVADSYWQRIHTYAEDARLEGLDMRGGESESRTGIAKAVWAGSRAGMARKAHRRKSGDFLTVCFARPLIVGDGDDDAPVRLAQGPGP